MSSLRKKFLLLIFIFSLSLACVAMQNPQTVGQRILSINMAMIAHWIAVYVTVSSMLVNFLAGVELFLKTVEDWARDSAQQQVENGNGGVGFTSFADRVRRWEFRVSVATDLVDRIGAINWKDKIRPRRWNKRASDPSTKVGDTLDAAARSAGIGS